MINKAQALTQSIPTTQTRCIFPDGRHLWGPECMRRAFSTVFDLDLGASSGEYRVFSTDVLAQLALNKHLMHRYPGIYGTALILKFSNQEFVNVPQELLRPEVLKEALVQIVAGPEVVREVSVQIVAE